MRVISSADGESWTSAGHFVLPAGDLRDAKLSITPDGELMLNSAIQVYHPYPDLHRNYVWFSKDGATWSDPVKIGEPDIWIWSVTWHDGVAYGIGYPNQNSDLQKTRLYKSDDGRKWDVLVSELHEGNESSIAFKADGTALCYLRGGHVIGQSLPLYTNWKWADTRDVGGPKLFGLPDGQYPRRPWWAMGRNETFRDRSRYRRIPRAHRTSRHFRFQLSGNCLSRRLTLGQLLHQL